MLNMSDKLREERRENSEKLLEKSKEKATEKREELQKALEENKSETEDKKTDGEQEKSGIIVVKENTPLEKAEQMLLEKLENSENGEIYLDDDDMQKIIEAVKEQAEKEAVKSRAIMQIRLEQILICRYKRKMAAIQPHKYKIIMISGGLIRID